jgi:hypothetical protein
MLKNYVEDVGTSNDKQVILSVRIPRVIQNGSRTLSAAKSRKLDKPH